MKLSLSRYQIKLFTLCLLFGAIPVIVLGIFSYLKSSSIIESKVLQGNDQLLLQTQTQLENTLKIIDFSIFQVASSQAVSDVLQIPIQAKDFPLVDKLLETLQRIQIYELGIRDIQLINLDYQWVISNKGYVKLDEFSDASRLSSYTLLDKPFKWISQVSDGQNGESKHSSITLVKRFPSYSVNPSALLVTQMSNQELFRLLPKSSELGSLVILDENGEIITDDLKSGFDLALRNSPLFGDVKQTPEASGYRIGRIGPEEYGFTFRKSSYNGWTYLSIVSIDSITRESKSIGWATIWASVIIIVLIILLSMQGANKLYSPLRTLYQRTAGSDDAPDPQEPQDEFQAIERRMEKMSQNYIHMTSHVQRLRQQLKPFMIFKLVQGELTHKEIEEQLQLFGFSRKFRWLAVVAIQIDTLEQTRYLESDRDLLLFAISNIVEDTVLPEHRLSPVVIEQSQVTVFSGNHESVEDFKAFMYDTIKQVQENVLAFLGLPVSAGISRPYSTYDCTPKAYAEGLDALKYRITKDTETILFIENEEPETQMVYFPEHLEKQLVEAVKFSDERRAAALLKEFLQILSNRELTHNQMQNWLMKLLLDLLYIPELPDTAFSSLDTNAIPLYVQLKRLNTVQEIEQWFTQQIIEPIIRSGEQSNEAPYNKISNEVIRIIQSEYDRELTLEECASRLNYHSSYIRRALKKSLDINFTDYLLTYRMEIAKKWLVETEMKISDMAQKLQYNNPQNFIRYFKKSTGITPGQYREMWFNNKGGE
ncbi:helix-turn-helix domain-containing protein [Paenibacillus sp. LMG 31456]|uniref:Helix-turn-helix domain-containing protein n=1 Tax=Paenibacillus foliorum TaxID=2654974 RepID=A0A972GQ32_9BACL|nr:helix-turn-helix domain-containing protein [Paenibacillus foliorum]NOU92324.1 helix-turn-helix domain-containing protein [Paenibacillus foliorum]